MFKSVQGRETIKGRWERTGDSLAIRKALGEIMLGKNIHRSWSARNWFSNVPGSAHFINVFRYFQWVYISDWRPSAWGLNQGLTFLSLDSSPPDFKPPNHLVTPRSYSDKYATSQNTLQPSRNHWVTNWESTCVWTSGDTEGGGRIISFFPGPSGHNLPPEQETTEPLIYTVIMLIVNYLLSYTHHYKRSTCVSVLHFIQSQRFPTLFSPASLIYHQWISCNPLSLLWL